MGKKECFSSPRVTRAHNIILSLSPYMYIELCGRVCKYAEHRCVFYSIHLIKTLRRKKNTEPNMSLFHSASPQLTPMWRIFREQFFSFCCCVCSFWCGFVFASPVSRDGISIVKMGDTEKKRIIFFSLSATPLPILN